MKLNWKQIGGLAFVGLLSAIGEIVSQLIFHDGGEEEEEPKKVEEKEES